MTEEPIVEAPEEIVHKPLSVFVATVAAFGLSLVNASVIGVLLGAVVIGLDLITFDDLQSLEQKLQTVLEFEPVTVVAGVLGTSSALFIIGVACVASERSRILERLRIRRTNFVDVALVAAGMLTLTHVLGQLIVVLGLEQVGSLAEFNRMFESWTRPERLRMLPILALCPGVAEEIFFRGYALTKLELAIGFRPAMVVTAILFGLIHLDPIHSIAATAMGLYLAYAIHLTQSLWTTVIAHILNNALAVLLPDILPEVFALQITVLVLGLVGFGLAMMGLMRRHRPPHADAVW